MNDKVHMISSFLRLYFALNEEIIEDICPLINKINSNEPICDKFKQILSTSAPSFFLLNNLLDNSEYWYNPPSSIKDQCEKLNEQFDRFYEVSKSFRNILQFHTIVQSIIRFHRHEITYTSLFDFLLTNIQRKEDIKIFLEFIKPDFLYAPCPIPENTYKYDFDIYEEEDVFKFRLKLEFPELIDKVEKMGHDCMYSLFLASNDVIDYRDLNLINPEFDTIFVRYDPLAINQANKSEVIKRKLKPTPRIDPRNYDKLTYSYIEVPDNRKKVTEGATALSVLCNNVAMSFDTCTSLGNVAHNFDGLATSEVVGACEKLHDKDVPLTRFTNGVARLMLNDNSSYIIHILKSIYDDEHVDIYNILLSNMQISSIIIDRIKCHIIKKSMDIYENYYESYERFCSSRIRCFVEPLRDTVEKCVLTLRTYVDSPLIEDMFSKIVSVYESGTSVSVDYSAYVIILFNYAFLFYLKFVSKYCPFLISVPPLPLINNGINMKRRADSLMNSCLIQLNLFVPQWCSSLHHICMKIDMLQRRPRIVKELYPVVFEKHVNLVCIKVNVHEKKEVDEYITELMK